MERPRWIQPSRDFLMCYSTGPRPGDQKAIGLNCRASNKAQKPMRVLTKCVQLGDDNEVNANPCSKWCPLLEVLDVFIVDCQINILGNNTVTVVSQDAGSAQFTSHPDVGGQNEQDGQGVNGHKEANTVSSSIVTIAPGFLADFANVNFISWI